MSANSFGKSFLNKTRGGILQRTMTSQLGKARKRQDLLTNCFSPLDFFSLSSTLFFSFMFFFHTNKSKDICLTR